MPAVIQWKDRSQLADLLSLAAGIRWSENRSGEETEGAGDRERQVEKGGCRPDAGQADPEGGSGGKLLSPERRRRCVDRVLGVLGVSERRACKVLKQPRSSQRYEPVPSEEGKALTEDIISLASEYGRYGYRRITALLRRKGWHVNHKKVERIWVAAATRA